MNESLKELAVRYFEGPIAPEEECELFGFLAASPENAALMREWEREWKQRHVPSADVLRSLARLNGKIERRENRIRARRRWLRFSAAAAVLILISAFTTRHLIHTEDPVQMFSVQAPQGTNSRISLPDGSQVWLNAGSKLEYPATFENASERCVRIEGEAFFEIKRDTCCPFCVELGDGECIRVLGTSFNVNAYAGNGRHVTTLVTGRIGYAASAGAEEVVLEPNQQVSRDLAAGTVAVSAVDASVYGAWKEGWLWFENESLPALAERLGRIYGIRVEVAARLGEYTFSGKIRQDRGVEYILNLLSETSDVICKVENGVMRLS